MTKEEKQLLLRDLCARLPYHVQCYSNIADHNWCILTPVVISNLFNATEDLVLKPYLRHLSSMTGKEWLKLKEWISITSDTNGEIYFGGFRDISAEDTIRAIDYLISHHFDYRGLIPMGLALEAYENMYKIA